MEYEQILRQVVISALPILIAIVMHEVAHGFVAYKLGDPTAKVMGRLTLNPIPHVDPFGTILMPLLLYVFTNGQFVFGYAKPVPINPFNFKNPKRDMAISAVGGPATNILLAIASAVLLKYLILPAAQFASDGAGGMLLDPLVMMFKVSVVVNVVLAVFNMIPIPPLDGGRVLMGFLPFRQSAFLEKIEPYGFIIVLVLVATGIASYIIWPVIAVILGLIRLI